MNAAAAVAALTAELVACRSVTPHDAGCLDILGARLAALGFALTRLPGGGVDNLWALRGGHGPCFAFAGHTDVVPPGPESDWSTPPFTPVVRDGRLYGRGAADMKGSLAAMVVAVERLLARRPDLPGRLAFILTSDEEGAATDGTVRVMEYLERERIALDWCVVGEPSSEVLLGDTLRVGRRGSLNGRLRVHGVQGHVAYPAAADNPVHRALPALAELAARSWDAGDAAYPPTAFQISNLGAGSGAENVIPGSLEVWFNFRFGTALSDGELRAAVTETLKRHDLRFDLEWRLSGQPFLTSGGRLIATASAIIAEERGIACAHSTGGGTSDGRFIAPYGVQVVELGPSNATIHKVDECVALDELEGLSVLYERIAEQMLAGT